MRRRSPVLKGNGRVCLPRDGWDLKCSGVWASGFRGAPSKNWPAGVASSDVTQPLSGPATSKYLVQLCGVPHADSESVALRPHDVLRSKLAGAIGATYSLIDNRKRAMAEQRPLLMA
jgi:hypothetical protein